MQQAQSNNNNLHQQSYWFSQHLEEFEPYEGKWVAIAHQEMVGVGESVGEAMTQAQAKGVRKPLVVRVPRKDEGPYVLYL